MANSDKQLSRWQRALTDLNAISSNDKVESYYTANWASSSFAIFATWRKGTLLFTKEKLVYMTTFGVNQFAINYSDIREAKKCFAGLLPMGMLVIAYDKKTDKTKKYKFWVAGRKKLIRLLNVTRYNINFIRKSVQQHTAPRHVRTLLLYLKRRQMRRLRLCLK